MTVQQASSQQLLFPLDLFFSATEMELIEELKLALEYRFCFEDTSEDHVVILVPQ
jgi:DNA mismatch repair protein MutL